MPIEFHWIVPQRLAGSGQPGLMTPLEGDLEELRREGIRLVVTLTEEPLALEPEQRRGIDWLHFPIDDMGIPSIRETARLCQEIVGSIAAGAPVLVHCKAGLGRTGTILACCLVSLGSEPEEAVTTIRRTCRRYVQTQGQEHFVRHFALYLQESNRSLPNRPR